jgi:hypothetical protein
LKRHAADAYYREIYLRGEKEWRQQAILAWAARLTAARTSKDVNRSAWFILSVVAPDNIRPVRDRDQCALLRDLAGPLPFRKLNIDPAWLAWNNGTVRRLAEQTYAERRLPEGTLDPTLLGVLADALVDASCDDTALLGQLRDSAPHWRGCFAVDLLLGKS